MVGVLLGAALVVGGLSQLSSEPNSITQFHAECIDREVVIFNFDMESAQSHVFRCRFLEAVCRMIRVVALPGKPIILHCRMICPIRPAIILRLRGSPSAKIANIVQEKS